MRPFFKYIHWIGATFFSFIQFTRPNQCTENPEGKKSENAESVPPETAPPLSVPPPPVPSRAIPSTVDSTSQQPGKYKKRALVYTEDNSEEEDDADMDMGDNDSSGSSVASDHVPAKRLRTSIATRSSRTTPAFEGPAVEVVARQEISSITRESSPAPDHPSIEPETSDDDDPPPTTHVNPANVNGSTLHVAPTPPANMDVDESDTGLETNNVAGVGVHEPVNPPPAIQPQPQANTATGVGVHPPVNPPPVAPAQPPAAAIPAFLTGRHNIYIYLSTVEESGFQDLLNNYVLFERTNRSHIRGALGTNGRPKAIGWWSGRARPDRLPPYDSLKSFTSSIVKWWILLQPEWRNIESGEISRGVGDWERLYQPGTNGLLNIVVLAYWWAKILDQREAVVDRTYAWFVADVAWVFSQLTEVARVGTFD